MAAGRGGARHRGGAADLGDAPSRGARVIARRAPVLLRSATIFAACCSALAAGPAAAHPHVFIDYTATILCHDEAITGVRLAWTFDEMYSASLYHDYTSRPKGPLSAADIAQLRTGAFQDTAEEHYFTDISLDGKPLPVTQVADFDASYDGRKMTYRFTVPLAIHPGHGDSIVEIASFDTEFYIDFELAKHDPVTIQGGAQVTSSCGAVPATRRTTTFGPLLTRIVRCRFGRAEWTQ
jgi:ABC-type uncharacterized transport system substrate-binding protein